jgi:hypothetical protein
VRGLVLRDLLKDRKVGAGYESARSQAGLVELALQVLEREREVEHVHDALWQTALGKRLPCHEAEGNRHGRDRDGTCHLRGA